MISYTPDIETINFKFALNGTLLWVLELDVLKDI